MAEEQTVQQTTTQTNVDTVQSIPRRYSTDNVEGLGVIGTAGEMWMQETWIGSTIRYGFDRGRDANTFDYRPDNNFNVYAHWTANRDKDNDMEAFVKDGQFDMVYSQQQYEARVASFRAQVADRAKLQNGSGFGMLVGGIGSIVDISTLIPGVNIAKRLGTASKVGKLMNSKPAKWATAGAQFSVVQEAGLHLMNDVRTIEESVLNTALSSGLGGGRGLNVSARRGDSFLNPSNPNYVFRPDSKVSMGVRGLGESLSESVVLKRVTRDGKQVYEAVAETGAGRSVGAAAVKSSEMAKRGALMGQGVARAGVKAVGAAGLAAVTKTVGRASPLIRGMTSNSGTFRDITSQLYNRGGMIDEAAEAGVATRSMEEVATNRIMTFRMEILGPVNEAFEKLRFDMAGADAGRLRSAKEKAADLGANLKGLASDVAAGPMASGEAKAVEQTTSAISKTEFEDIIAAAAHEDIDDAMIDNLIDRFGKGNAMMVIQRAKEQANVLHDYNLRLEDELVELGMMTEKERLGRKFVSPQLWDGKAIRRSPIAARNFFMQLFADDPTEEFLEATFGMTKEQFGKLGVEDVTVKNSDGEPTVYTVAQGATAKNEILGEWTGDLYRTDLKKLQKMEEDADLEATASRKEAVRAAAEFRSTNFAIIKASVKEAKDILLEQIAKRDQRKLNRDNRKAKNDRMLDEVRKLEAEAKQRQRDIEQMVKTGRPGQKIRLQAEETVKEAKALLDMVNYRGQTATKKEVLDAEANLTAADIDLANIDKPIRTDAEGRAKAKQPRSTRISYLQGKIDKNTQAIKKLDKELDKLDAKIDPLRRNVVDATQKRKQLLTVQKLRRAAMNDQAKGARKAKRKLKQAKRLTKRKENDQPLEQYVNELTNTLGSRTSSQAPRGALSTDVLESSRLKERMIKLTNEQRREAHQLGILKNDMYESLYRANIDIAQRMAFRHTFGHFGGSETEILNGMIKAVDDDYLDMIAKAQREGVTKKQINTLDNERLKAVKDVELGVRRQLGQLDLPADPESLLNFTMQKVREFNYIRYGSGFVIPSLTDLSNTALTTGFGTMSYRNLKALNQTLRNMGNAEIKSLAYALELMGHGNRTMAMNGADDARLQAGVGDYGTVKHYTTSTVDRIMRGLSDTTSYASGMMWWNSRLKMLAMVEMQNNFTRLSKDYDSLLAAASANDPIAKGKIAQLAASGLGSTEMRNIQKMFKKYPPKENDAGVFELGMARWLKEGREGQTAHQDVMIALENAANRAVMTPSKGDTPFLMSNEYAKIIGQFQTYGFVVMTKFMVPAFQRMANYGDMQAFSSFAFALALGTAVVGAKDMLRYGEIKERDAGSWAYDAIDRSGFLTYLSTPIDAIATQTGMSEGASRYSRENARLSLVLGPSAGLLTDTFNLAFEDNRLETAQKLLPFKLYQQIYNVATGGYK